MEPVWNSELEVAFEDPSEASRLRGQIGAALAGLTGITTGLGQPIEHRLSHVLSGTAADLTVELYHEDQGQLEAAAATVAAALSGVPGLRNVNAQRTLTVEGLTVDWDREALTRVGLTAGEAADQLRLAVEGEQVGRLVEGARWMDLVVRLDRDQRRSAWAGSPVVASAAPAAAARRPTSSSRSGSRVTSRAGSGSGPADGAVVWAAVGPAPVV